MLFSSFLLLACVNGQRRSRFVQLHRPLSLFAATQQSVLLGSPASEANLRNVFSLCCDLKSMVYVFFLWTMSYSVRAAHTASCESCVSAVVIISSSHVTQWCVRVCLSLYVRACLWAGACLCLHDSRSEREVTRAAAEGWERQTLCCCRVGEKGVRARGAGKPQTDKKVRQEQRS